MIKITNIQAARMIGVLLILLSVNAFAGKPKIPPPPTPPPPAYATQAALNAEVTTRANADIAEVAARNAAMAVEAAARDAAIAVETARAKVAEAAGAGITIADGTHKGDILEWDGFAWTPVATEPVYILGDIRPDGGIVYYVDGSGHHGLAAQPNDEAGVMNWTDAMAAAAAHNNPACPTDTLRTPTCWHAPTKTELEYLFEQKDVVGNFFVDVYWTSTILESSGLAYTNNFYRGTSDVSGLLVGVIRVRAVQAF